MSGLKKRAQGPFVVDIRRAGFQPPVDSRLCLRHLVDIGPTEPTLESGLVVDDVRGLLLSYKYST